MKKNILGDTRVRQKFAFLPKKTSEGQKIWLEWYIAVERFERRCIGWKFLKIHIYRWCEKFSTTVNCSYDEQRAYEFMKKMDSFADDPNGLNQEC